MWVYGGVYYGGIICGCCFSSCFELDLVLPVQNLGKLIERAVDVGALLALLQAKAVCKIVNDQKFSVDENLIQAVK